MRKNVRAFILCARTNHHLKGIDVSHERCNSYIYIYNSALFEVFMCAWWW